ncbi:lysozyme inhibitor LprI family protein [Ferriphaselus sp. R-1]|uniref:lysozyme inhibitor LprI family protein n=1 Tax=Ferriphaselus sp. R-1 TaxID=1485544 RepID=UPI0013774BCE|nr:lysozyme inhibitor LprI family protein [Ferriphaselus sp. R-1]
MFLVAAGLSSNVLADCEWREGISHSEYRQCLVAEAQWSVAKLDQAEKTLQLRISTAGEEESFTRRAIELLDASMDSFRKFRVSFCEFEASTAAGGSAAGDLRLRCEIKLNQDFARRLIVPAGSLTEAR